MKPKVRKKALTLLDLTVSAVLSVLVASAQPSFNFIVNTALGSRVFIKATPEVSTFHLASFKDLVRNIVSFLNLIYLSGGTLGSRVFHGRESFSSLLYSHTEN